MNKRRLKGPHEISFVGKCLKALIQISLMSVEKVTKMLCILFRRTEFALSAL